MSANNRKVKVKAPRPPWVRQGANFYFAQQQPSQNRTRTRKPKRKRNNTKNTNVNWMRVMRLPAMKQALGQSAVKSFNPRHRFKQLAMHRMIHPEFRNQNLEKNYGSVVHHHSNLGHLKVAQWKTNTTRLLRNYGKSKDYLLSRKRELKAELKQVNAILLAHPKNVKADMKNTKALVELQKHLKMYWRNIPANEDIAARIAYNTFKRHGNVLSKNAISNINAEYGRKKYQKQTVWGPR